MKNIKRFGIDVVTTFGGGGEDYTEFNPLVITDLETSYANAIEGSTVAEITIFGRDESEASFRLNVSDIEALSGVLTHIRNKVLEQKPE